MSYYLDMGFVNVKDKFDAYEKAKKFCDKCKESYKEMLDIQKYYIPEIRMGNKYQCANIYWIYGTFTFNFIYWEKYELLGIKGCGFPLEATKLFDVFIPFQNGTDQDYDMKEWGDSINVFNEIVDKFKNADYELIKNTIIKKWGSWDEETEENIEYYRRTCIYEEICDKIDFHSFLYDKEGDFERFSMCAINTQQELMDISTYIRYLVYKEKEENSI